MKLNVAYACNEAYMEQTTVSLISLFENNKQFEDIYVYFIDMGITKNSEMELIKLVNSYGRNLEVISFHNIAYDLNVKNTGRHIESVYAKIFFGRLSGIDRILYLDSDTVICDSLLPLWTIDFHDCVCAGVETLHSADDNKAMGLTAEEKAINDGVILMNLKTWREGQYLEKCLTYIKANNGDPPVLSEGTINAVCRNKILIIDPRYNLMSGIVNQKQGKLEVLTGRKYYPQSILDNASRDPCVIHYLSGFYNRPWNKRCTHPLKGRYLYYKSMSSYGSVPLKDTKPPFRLRLIGVMYRILPIYMFVAIRKIFNE